MGCELGKLMRTAFLPEGARDDRGDGASDAAPLLANRETVPSGTSKASRLPVLIPSHEVPSSTSKASRVPVLMPSNDPAPTTTREKLVQFRQRLESALNEAEVNLADAVTMMRTAQNRGERRRKLAAMDLNSALKVVKQISSMLMNAQVAIDAHDNISRARDMTEMNVHFARTLAMGRSVRESASNLARQNEEAKVKLEEYADTAAAMSDLGYDVGAEQDDDDASRLLAECEEYLGSASAAMVAAAPSVPAHSHSLPSDRAVAHSAAALAGAGSADVDSRTLRVESLLASLDVDD